MCVVVYTKISIDLLNNLENHSFDNLKKNKTNYKEDEEEESKKNIRRKEMKNGTDGFRGRFNFYIFFSTFIQPCGATNLKGFLLDENHLRGEFLR